MAKRSVSSPPVQQEIFPPLTVSDAIEDFTKFSDEVRLLHQRMQDTLTALHALPNGSAFHVQYVDSVTFYQGVLLTLKL